MAKSPELKSVVGYLRERDLPVAGRLAERVGGSVIRTEPYEEVTFGDGAIAVKVAYRLPRENGRSVLDFLEEVDRLQGRLARTEPGPYPQTKSGHKPIV